MKQFILFSIGVALTISVALGMDMIGNHGKVAAQHIHHAFPECSNSCHG